MQASIQIIFLMSKLLESNLSKEGWWEKTFLPKTGYGQLLNWIMDKSSC